ncbi:Bug family tripartite tricarboxylate transporter substrate binding protein [Pseudooceanicola onchidii]|uniref:Bug family tripartite tricarboxylate transporter substrate binding protein n=1 Tax=Pseudooceanicola onchidii TaxID=2562279 RepID=UPI0010AA6CE7|nr:tripartite tricarboxylate transporter substrate binding protein [Pseudooceanicola onchidii]
MFKLTRRAAIAAVGATVALGLPQASVAQSDEPITLVVPYGGGGLIDGIVRQVADMMTTELGQTVLVENKPGANGIIGASYVAAAKNDGLTYLIGATGPISLNILLRPNLPYGFDSFEPVATMLSGPLTVTVPTAIGVDTIEGLADYAKQTGKPLRYATLGPGSVTHLFGLTLKKELGVEMNDVAYRNNPSSLVDMIGGQNELNFSSPISLLEHQKAGDIKILAVTTPERMEQFPDLPTTTELGFPSLVSSFWFGVMAPAGSPDEMTSKVSTAVQNAMQDQDLQDKMFKVGMTPQVGGADALQAQLDSDKEFWGKVVTDNNITLE